MPIYKVKHTTKSEYTIIVEAEDEKQAQNEVSYFAACNMPASDYYWHDSEIMEELDDDQEADISLIETEIE